MRTNLTEIICIVDRSGSMSSIKKDAIGGFNQFLEDQKKVDGAANFTYAQFDTEYDLVHDCVDIQEVEPLNEETYVPRGMTALLDAIGKTIVTVGERLKKTDEDERPAKVAVIVLTDGQENSSKEYRDAAVIRDMIKHQEERYAWEFVYLAANQDAIHVGGQLGFAGNKVMNFAANAKGTKDAYRGMSGKMTDYRTSLDSSAGVVFDSSDASEQAAILDKDDKDGE